MKKIINIVIFIAVLYVFFAFGGFTFIKDKYGEYTSPPRAVFVEEEKNFGDLSDVSADYTFSRSLNFFGYKKLNALYLPKKQRITILDLNSDNFLTENDFKTGVLEGKLENFSSKIVNSPIVPVENIKITKIGKVKAGNCSVPYANFEADVKIVPLFKVKGTVALYRTKNRENAADKAKKRNEETLKLVLSCKFPTGYEENITTKFISQIKL